MKPLYALACAGFLTLFAPGCCILDVFGHGNSYSQCGSDPCSCGGHHGKKHSKKCSKHCRKCMECMQEGYVDGYAMGDCGCGGAIMGDCGCGGGGMIGDMGGGGCGCGAGGPAPYPSGPLPGPIPGPTPSTGAIPPIPGMEVAPPPQTSSTMTVPAGMTQVSVEEFQRLPGVVISGPGAQPMATDMAAQSVSTSATPTIVAAPQEARPIPTTASRVQSVQQTGWAPTRQ